MSYHLPFLQAFICFVLHTWEPPQSCCSLSEGRCHSCTDFLMNPNPEGDGAPEKTTFKKPLPPHSRGDLSAGRSSGGLGTGKRKPSQGNLPRATTVPQQNPQRPNKRKFLISRSMGTLRAFPQGGKRKRIDTATTPLQRRDVVDPPRTVQSDVVGFGDQTCLTGNAESDPGNKEKYAEGERIDLDIYTER